MSNGNGFLCLAVVAETENLQTVPLDSEIVTLAEFGDDWLDWAGGERHDVATVRADQVMPMSRLADDIGWMPVGLQQPRQNIY